MEWMDNKFPVDHYTYECRMIKIFDFFTRLEIFNKEARKMH